MEILVLIISSAALLGVAVSLIGFLQKIPKTERLAVMSLMGVGGVLVVVIVLFLSSTRASEQRDEELCQAANNNREAIATMLAALEPTSPNAAALNRAGEQIDGPVC